MPELAPTAWPIRSWPRGPGSRWKRFPARQPTKRCGRRPARCKGKLLVGTINSIGVRRDAGAVDLLTGRLKDPDAEVASAAAVALGHIGNAAATKTLRQIVGRRSCRRSVRRLPRAACCAPNACWPTATQAEAVEIYDEVRRADVPKQRILEATRGAILARKSDGIPLLVEQLRSPDKDCSRSA